MQREDEGAGHRHVRLEGLILEELRALLRDDVEDPRLEGVRLAAAVLSVDYKQVRVHFVLNATHYLRAPTERALERATPFLRARLGEAIDLKRLPDLRFLFDGYSVPDDSVES